MYIDVHDSNDIIFICFTLIVITVLDIQYLTDFKNFLLIK